MFAGTDTTSTTLTYLFWELSRHPSYQQQIREELQLMNAGDSSGVPAYNDIQALPILDSVINEALRLHPAAPASLPRETPPSGTSLNGYYVPEKVYPYASAQVESLC